jgi:hypothetical protein
LGQSYYNINIALRLISICKFWKCNSFLENPQVGVVPSRMMFLAILLATLAVLYKVFIGDVGIPVIDISHLLDKSASEDSKASGLVTFFGSTPH